MSGALQRLRHFRLDRKKIRGWHLVNGLNYVRGNDGTRWVGYFDLLGTRKLVADGKMREVFRSFAEAAKGLETLNRPGTAVLNAWFSDTFIIYSDNDSQQAFAVVEKTCRWFMTHLIWHNVPVRGSISCGRFYSDRASSIYFGPALIEAYEWGEGQDWIGLVLCPSCIERLENLNQSPADYKYYVEYVTAPFMKSPPGDARRCAACILGDWVRTGHSGPSDLLPNLREMRDMQTDAKIIRKYSRAIDFIEGHQTQLPGS